ncbi:MAG: DEAD/DEAH box helicase, partial [Clostridia bacterium]
MFLGLNLSEEIVKALELNGYETPTEVQAKCIPAILEGKDIVGRSVTGSGKTFAFGLPAIQMIDTMENAVQVLVVCPTRELCLQVTDEIRKISGYMEGR